MAESVQRGLLTGDARYCDYACERVDGFLIDFGITNTSVRSTVEIVLSAKSMVYRKSHSM